MASMAGGRAPAGGSKRQALRKQALDFLISSQWLIGEAGERGVRLSAREVEQRFKAKKSASFPGGPEEFHEFLKQTGQKVSDVMLEVRAGVADSRLRQMLVSKEHEITQAQIAAYYHGHKHRFTVPEQREFEATNRKTTADANKLKREVESGKTSFDSVSRRGTAERPQKLIPGSKLEAALYSAKPHVLIGPVKQRVDYYLLEITRITPARLRPLAQVQGSISKQLVAAQRRRALAKFVAEWRSKWIARTDCSPGYIVQKCRQYSSAKAPEDPVALS